MEGLYICMCVWGGYSGCERGSACRGCACVQYHVFWPNSFVHKHAYSFAWAHTHMMNLCVNCALLELVMEVVLVEDVVAGAELTVSCGGYIFWVSADGRVSVVVVV